jgi:hypothetical protein
LLVCLESKSDSFSLSRSPAFEFQSCKATLIGVCSEILRWAWIRLAANQGGAVAIKITGTLFCQSSTSGVGPIKSQNTASSV